MARVKCHLFLDAWDPPDGLHECRPSRLANGLYSVAVSAVWTLSAHNVTNCTEHVRCLILSRKGLGLWVAPVMLRPPI